MKLKLNQNELKRFLSPITFLVSGDDQEKQFSGLVIDHFPKCEEFWRVFVVPLTMRIEIPFGEMKDKIRFRDELEPQLMNIASAHYSMLMHLVYAQVHFDRKCVPSYLENIYTHLATACDLAESLLENWYLVLLECQGKQPVEFTKLTRNEFMERAGVWYDENFIHAYEYYHSKGKPYNMPVPIGKYLLKEYLGTNPMLKEYLSFSNNIRAFRNAVVHGVVQARIIDPVNKIVVIPKPEKISKYRSWRDIQNATSPDIIEKDFSEEDTQLQESIQSLEIRLNNLWSKLIQDFEGEFYSLERSQLRQMFRIEFTDSINEDSLKFPYSPESGTFSRPGILKNIITSGSPVTNLQTSIDNEISRKSKKK